MMAKSDVVYSAAPRASANTRHDSTVSSCRFCGNQLHQVFADLGVSPLANSYLDTEQVKRMEPFYPLCALVCDRCYLVQLEEFESPDSIFSDYAYFSSYSTSWLEHARSYAHAIVERLGLGPNSLVCELASNDGYLLRWFVDMGIPVLGVEPAQNVAEAAIANGVPTVRRFFGCELAAELASQRRADLLIGNNVLAHVPALNDFVGGMKIMLAPGGTITMEFPHLKCLVDEQQFDTIYHEHFSYFSFLTVRRIFAAHGLTIFDVEELRTHGGSLRIYAQHVEDEPVETETARVLAERERAAGYEDLALYVDFEAGVRAAKRDLLDFFIGAKRDGLFIAGYGAPAKATTLLNYCGIDRDFIPFTVDRSPHKQGKFLPGTHIPILAPEAIDDMRPEILFVLPWNLRDEVMDQMSHIRRWGGRFAFRTPKLEIVP
jgi:2-polyprenyl-3-methyl-5-hydroxy-6-metoxy-1,4-benzoquinol methylase